MIFIFGPALVFAQVKQEGDGFVPCGITNKPLDKDGKGGNLNIPCTFDHVLILINNIVNFALFYLAIPIAAIVFVYAGVQLLISGGNSEAMAKAKRAFTSAALGIVLAVGAWLIIHTILTIVGYDGSWIGL